MTIATPQHRPHCAAPNLQLHHVRFVTHASAPTVAVDKADVVASIARNDTGDFTLTLNGNYTYVMAFASLVNATDDTFAQVNTVVEGTSANTVKVTVVSSGSAADLAGSDVNVLLVLQPSA